LLCRGGKGFGHHIHLGDGARRVAHGIAAPKCGGGARGPSNRAREPTAEQGRGDQ
jgi:hypothetical protein